MMQRPQEEYLYALTFGAFTQLQEDKNLLIIRAFGADYCTPKHDFSLSLNPGSWFCTHRAVGV